MRLVMALLLLGQVSQAQVKPDVDALGREAGRLREQGKYAAAIPLAEQAFAIREKALGPDHPDTAASLNDLCRLYRLQGVYGKAEPLCVRALVIREKALGPDHPDTAASLDNLGELYQLQAAYGKAEPLLVRALAIYEKTFGPDHLDTAIGLGDLGELYQLQGAYGKAEPLLVRSLAIYEKTYGPDHTFMAARLGMLADLYRLQGAYAKAEPLCVRALAISEKGLGPDHKFTGFRLNNLADLYRLQGAYGKAEPLYVRALAIYEKALGPDHPDTAISLDHLAVLYQSQGAYGKAEPLYIRALAIQEEALGPDHPDTATTLNDLADLYRLQGAYGKAEPLYIRALAIREKALGLVHPDTLASQRNLALVLCAKGAWTEAAARLPSLIDNQRNRWDLAFGRDSEKKSVIAARESLLAALHAGALLPDQRSVYLPLLLQTALASKARVADENHASLEALKRRVGSDDRKLIQELEDVWSNIGALMQDGPGKRPLPAFRKSLQDLELMESDLSATIAARSASFRKLGKDPTPREIAKGLQGRILIEVLRVARFQSASGQLFGDALYTAVALFPDGRMDMVDLGAAQPIDDLIDAYRQAQQVIDNREPADALAQRLGEAIVAPIAKMAGASKEWDLSPDGDIRLLPINALRLDGKYVAETHRIWPLGSGRDLLTLDVHIESGVDDLILANPDFGNGSAFTPLPETEEEAESIAEAFGNAQIVEPANRTKLFLLDLTTAPRVLHLATHAFYNPGYGDPTLRSGIALNGANAGPDGILTAKEAQTLRLRGTQLVVMSACETGVGEVSFGDGIVGFQRSFTLAGAQTEVLTQWRVNSARTSDFMRRFYSKLAAGSTKGDAWLDTQRDLIREGVAPHFWAPFVLYGDPGPMGEK